MLKTAGPDLDEMVIDPEAGVKAAFGENPKRVYSDLKKMPGTRMGIAALLRQALVDAQDYEMKKEKDAEEGEVFERDLGMELLVRLLNREIPLRAHAHRSDDIYTAIRIAREFDLKMSRRMIRGDPPAPQSVHLQAEFLCAVDLAADLAIVLAFSTRPWRGKGNTAPQN